jgi:hypothetical protein
MIRRVSIWKKDWDPRASDLSGPPVEDRFPPLSDDEADRLVTYLNAGVIVLHTTAMLPDPLSGSSIPQVRISQRTDGVWAWDDSVAYFAKKYRISPGIEFLGYLRSRNFLQQQPSPEIITQVRSQLGLDMEF